MDNSDNRFSPELPVRVFLVEDNPEHSFIAVRVLHQLLGEGSEIIVAESAEEAIGLISQFTEHDRPDLILVDLRLPDNRGSSNALAYFAVAIVGVNPLLRRALGNGVHIPRNSPLPLTCLGAKTHCRYRARTHPSTPPLAPVRACPPAHPPRRVRRSKVDCPLLCSISHPHPHTPRRKSSTLILCLS